MLVKAHTVTCLRFRRWSRKSYAAFQSIGKHVTIGNLKNIIADTFLGKQKNTSSLIDNDIMHREMDDAASDPPDEMIELLPALLPVIPKSICTKAAYLKFFIYILFMADSIIAVSHFYFNS